jgi:hypothetical protein
MTQLSGVRKDIPSVSVGLTAVDTYTGALVRAGSTRAVRAPCVEFLAVLLRLPPIGNLPTTASSNGRSATLLVDFTARPWVFVLR